MIAVSISAMVFDPAGVVRIAHPRRSTAGDLARRINTVSTLDGTAAVNDYGVAASGHTIDLEWQLCGIEHNLRRMMRLYGQVRAATANGCFLVALQRYSEQDGRARLTMPVIRRLSE